MKFELIKEVFSDVIKGVTPAREKRGDSLIRGILIDIKDGKATFTASNSEYSISKEVELNLGYYDDGKIVIGDTFIDIIDKLSDNLVCVETVGENEAKITCQNFKCTQRILPGDSFFIKKLDGEGGMSEKISGELFKKIVKSTVFACAKAETTNDPIRTGVLFSTHDDVLSSVGLDGVKIAEKTMQYNGNINAVISGKMLDELVKIVGDDVEIQSYPNGYRVVTDGYVINASLLEGTFPDYKRIVPKEFKTTIKTNRDEFAAAISRIGAADKSLDKSITVFSEGKAVTLSRESAVEEISAEFICGDSIDVTLSMKYLSDILKVFDENVIYFKYNGSTAPIVITNESEDSKYTLLPIYRRK